MIDKDALARRAVAVKALLDNEEIQAAWVEIEQELFEDWKACQDPAKRDQFWHMIANLEQLKVWMHSAASVRD